VFDLNEVSIERRIWQRNQPFLVILYRNSWGVGRLLTARRPAQPVSSGRKFSVKKGSGDRFP
jgi:hypothetical protein